MKMLLLSFLLSIICHTTEASPLRLPAMAGQFYPQDPSTLQKTIKKFLDQVPDLQKSENHLYGFIVPHAGYMYSGQTAAFAYKILQSIPVDTIVLIGPYHQQNFEGASIWAEGKWETPLGKISIDQELAQKIKLQSKDFQVDSSLHLAEHSLEVQVPFLQTIATKVKFVPILISNPAYAQSLAKAIHAEMPTKRIVVIASTDLSHYHSNAQARQIDKVTLQTIQAGNPDKFKQALDKGKIELCGSAAVLTLLHLSKLWKAQHIEILNTANSGDVTKDTTNVVGYASAIVRGNGTLSLTYQQELLKLARNTLRDYLDKGKHALKQSTNPLLSQPKAVFVTLRDRQGILKGCIGRLQAEEPLYHAIQHMVVEAATKDSRFAPVQSSELNQLKIEISVLSNPKLIKSADEIQVGVHGIIISKGDKSGVFLPDVAKEFKTREDFLSELCTQKAGLPGDCWSDPSVKLQVFTTEEFGES